MVRQRAPARCRREVLVIPLLLVALALAILFASLALLVTPSPLPRRLNRVSNLSGVSEMSNIKLSWVDPATLSDGKSIPADFFKSVDIALSADAGVNFSTIATVDPGVQTYTVQDLPPGTYQFNVTAQDALGRASSVSNVIVTVAAPIPAVLSPVTSLTATVE